ncbi:unnamed protein product [Durusdinium trenchii]|uniref:Uncharacterized protein n=1 Tax=Durusdinium trenchii TaxID=1381693 RepID=A0ABP0JKP5_9DINO
MDCRTSEENTLRRETAVDVGRAARRAALTGAVRPLKAAARVVRPINPTSGKNYSLDTNVLTPLGFWSPSALVFFQTDAPRELPELTGPLGLDDGHASASAGSASAPPVALITVTVRTGAVGNPARVRRQYGRGIT